MTPGSEDEMKAFLKAIAVTLGVCLGLFIACDVAREAETDQERRDIAREGLNNILYIDGYPGYVEYSYEFSKGRGMSQSLGNADFEEIASLLTNDAAFWRNYILDDMGYMMEVPGGINRDWVYAAFYEKEDDRRGMSVDFKRIKNGFKMRKHRGRSFSGVSLSTIVRPK